MTSILIVILVVVGSLLLAKVADIVVTKLAIWTSSNPGRSWAVVGSVLFIMFAAAVIWLKLKHPSAPDARGF